MATIKRTIYIETLENIDFSNVGLHWTAKNYMHSFSEARSPYATEERNPLTGEWEAKKHFMVCFSVAFSYAAVEVNTTATAQSRRDYKHECEVILAPEQQLYAVVRIYEMLGSDVKYFIHKERKLINTGTRCDAWVKNP
jgi:hypothetical protein